METAAKGRKRGRKDKRERDDRAAEAAPTAEPAATATAVAEAPEHDELQPSGSSTNGSSAHPDGDSEPMEPAQPRRGLLRRKSRRKPPGELS